MTNTPILIDLEDEDDPDFPATTPTPLPISVVMNAQNSIKTSDVRAGQIPSQTGIPIHIPGVGNSTIVLNHNSSQMPPPTWPHPSRSGGTSQTQMIQTVRTSHVVAGAGAGGHQMVNTTVNLFVSTAQRATAAAGNHTISNLWNKPAFSNYDDDTSSILCLGEVPSKNQSPFNLSVNHNTLNSLNPQSQPIPDLLITPPVSPRDMSSPSRRTSMSSDHGSEGTEAVAVAPKIGQKRPAPPVEPVACSSGNKRRIAPIPISHRPHSLIPHTPNPINRDNPSSSASISNAVSQNPSEPAVVRKEARIVVQKCQLAEARLKANNSAAPTVLPELAEPSSHITTASSSLSEELRKAEAMIMASFEGYIHEKLSKKYDLSKPDNIRRAIDMLKVTNKYMQPGRKRAREILNLMKRIDRDSYDLEIQRIFEKKNLKEKNDKMKKEAEISKLVTELEGYEEKLKELDHTGIFEHETEARSAEKALVIATLCERYAVYKKLVGKEDEVFQMLHKEKFKKIDLSNASLHPQINKAVEELLDKRRKELFKGGHKDGWDEIYPLFSELKTVVIQAVVEHNIGVTLTDIQMISDDLYHSMVKQSRCGRGKDFMNNVDIYIGCSKTKADALLKADPVHTSKELANQLDINKTTSESNMKLLYEMFEDSLPDSATADTPTEDPEVEEEGEGEEESGELTESDSCEDDEETEEDRMFIDDENSTSNNSRNFRPPSPAPSLSTMSSYMENHDSVNSRPPCSSSQGIPGTSANVNASTSTSTTGPGPGTTPAHNAATAIILNGYHNRSFPNR